MGVGVVRRSNRNTEIVNLDLVDFLPVKVTENRRASQLKK